MMPTTPTRYKFEYIFGRFVIGAFAGGVAMLLFGAVALVALFEYNMNLPIRGDVSGAGFVVATGLLVAAVSKYKPDVDDVEVYCKEFAKMMVAETLFISILLMHYLY